MNHYKLLESTQNLPALYESNELIPTLFVLIKE